MSNFPSLYRRAINFIKALYVHVKTGMKKVSRKVYTERIMKCTTCKFNVNGGCSLCGCIIVKKAEWKTSECPDNRW